MTETSKPADAAPVAPAAAASADTSAPVSTAAAPTAPQAPGDRPANPRPHPRRNARGGAGRGPSRGQAGGNDQRSGKAPGPDRRAGGAAPAPARSHPLLDELAGLYPHLFGEAPLPLKRGIFQDLLDAHPETLQAEPLKAALALHTRATRYLTSVAAGQKRHDLQGQPVEDMAPEHVYHALTEVFRRRQTRSPEDLGPKLRQRIVQAYEASGLAPEAYGALVRGRNEAANAVLDAALADATQAAAKDEALLRAFEASGQAVEAFADMYGLDPRQAARTLERARKRRG